MEKNKFRTLVEALIETGHFLVYTASVEHEGVYLVADPSLYGRPEQIQQIMRTCYHDDNREDPTCPYVLLICPQDPLLWDGRVLEVDMREPIIDINPSQCSQPGRSAPGWPQAWPARGWSSPRSNQPRGRVRPTCFMGRPMRPHAGRPRAGQAAVYIGWVGTRPWFVQPRGRPGLCPAPAPMAPLDRLSTRAHNLLKIQITWLKGDHCG